MGTWHGGVSNFGRPDRCGAGEKRTGRRRRQCEPGDRNFTALGEHDAADALRGGNGGARGPSKYLEIGHQQVNLGGNGGAGANEHDGRGHGFGRYAVSDTGGSGAGAADKDPRRYWRGATLFGAFAGASSGNGGGGSGDCVWSDELLAQTCAEPLGVGRDGTGGGAGGIWLVECGAGGAGMDADRAPGDGAVVMDLRCGGLAGLGFAKYQVKASMCPIVRRMASQDQVRQGKGGNQI